MHELALTQAIVEMCAERAGGARVRRVTVEVGALSGVAEEALRFCYELAAAGTPLEGSRLEIARVPATARCAGCGLSFPVAAIQARCRCGSMELRYEGGEALLVKRMELD